MRSAAADDGDGAAPPRPSLPATAVPVLVLNASMEPLSVVPTRRAVVLTLTGKAEVVQADGRVLRSASLVLRAPSVVRLHRYVRVPRTARAGLSRRAVLLRDGGRCQYCGGAAEDIDHVLPRSRGGRHSWDNVVAACRRCNARKQDRTPGEAGLTLARAPQPPPPAFWLLVRAGVYDATWTPYLDPYLGERWRGVIRLLPPVSR